VYIYIYIYIYMVVGMDPYMRFLREVSLFNFGLLRVCITIFFHRFIKNKRKEECKSQRKEGFLILLPDNFFISCLSQNNFFIFLLIIKKLTRFFFCLQTEVSLQFFNIYTYKQCHLLSKKTIQFE
jgi:hypothetical protein